MVLEACVQENLLFYESEVLPERDFEPLGPPLGTSGRLVENGFSEFLVLCCFRISVMPKNA